MSSEIEKLSKRLKAAEHAINKLKEQDLLIAKVVGLVFGSMGPNIVARTLKGEELESFVDFKLMKLDPLLEELKAAQTVESVFDIVDKFDTELTGYVRATKIDTADKAMEVAHTFIKKYSPVALPLKAERQDDVWLVDIDVGALAVKVAKVKVDAKTGDILSYEIPPK